MFEFMHNSFGPVYYILHYFGINKELDKVLLIIKMPYLKFMKIHTEFSGCSILE